MTKSKRNKFIHFIKSGRLAKWVLGLAKAVFIIGICFTILYPLLTKFSMSLMDQRDLFDPMVKFIPNTLRLSNYPELIGYMKYWPALSNTLVLSTIVSVAQVISCSAVGYGFAKFNFKGKKLLFAGVIIAMILPPFISITPLYLNFKSFTLFGLLPPDTMVGNIGPFLALALTASAPRCGLYILSLIHI